MHQSLAKEIASMLANRLGGDWTIQRVVPFAGGDINQAMVLDCVAQRVFVKYRHAASNAIHLAEQQSLQTIAASGVLRVPRPLMAGHVSRCSFLVMEHLPIVPLDEAMQRKLGAALAQMHRQTAESFGWSQDNFIGTAIQSNGWLDDWPTFFARQRLAPQLRLLDDPELSRLGGQLSQRLGRCFDSYQPEPSLLHGDLWAGNAGAVGSEPVIFDPASYYGDRETDLAMMELFGGFSASCWAAYREVWPLDDGYERRRPLYQLYHVLNHANLFGGGYRSRAKTILQRLLGEI